MKDERVIFICLGQVIWVRNIIDVNETNLLFIYIIKINKQIYISFIRYKFFRKLFSHPKVCRTFEQNLSSSDEPQGVDRLCPEDLKMESCIA